MKNYAKKLLLSLVLAPCVCFADAASDAQETADIRKKILSHLQDEARYEERDAYSRSILNQILPRIATSVVVCDGQVFIQNAQSANSLPVQIYEKTPLDIDVTFDDQSGSFTTADKLNGYQWQGGVSIDIDFDTYKPLTSNNWSSGGSVTYSYGNSYYDDRLIIKDNQLLKPQQGQFQSDESYKKSSYNRLVELNNYPPLSCEAIEKSLKNYNNRKNLANGLNVILGIANVVQQVR